jgi:hypothetical protein
LGLRVLRLLRDATERGIITWARSETDKDWYHTRSGPLNSHIHFKWPSYNGEVGSDRDFVEVGGAGRFMVGTPGWALALEILAAGFAPWRRHVAGLREGYEREIKDLTRALRGEKIAAKKGAAGRAKGASPRPRRRGRR